jgi:hypothetical protein
VERSLRNFDLPSSQGIIALDAPRSSRFHPWIRAKPRPPCEPLPHRSEVVATGGARCVRSGYGVPELLGRAAWIAVHVPEVVRHADRRSEFAVCERLREGVSRMRPPSARECGPADGNGGDWGHGLDDGVPYTVGDFARGHGVIFGAAQVLEGDVALAVYGDKQTRRSVDRFSGPFECLLPGFRSKPAAPRSDR